MKKKLSNYNPLGLTPYTQKYGKKPSHYVVHDTGVSEVTEFPEEKRVYSRTVPVQEKSRYFADKRGGEQEPLKQYQIPLEEYLTDLREFSIIKDVYVLNDEREDEGVIGILVKLIPLMSIDADVFDAENNKVTNYLKATGILDAKEIHVSFQYTEVF